MATFKIEKEDHTLGNLLCRAMQKHPKVLFAGYRVPHPLEHNFVLKVQTDASTTPLDALQQTVNTLLQDLTLLEEQVKVNGKVYGIFRRK